MGGSGHSIVVKPLFEEGNVVLKMLYSLSCSRCLGNNGEVVSIAEDFCWWRRLREIVCESVEK